MYGQTRSWMRNWESDGSPWKPRFGRRTSVNEAENFRPIFPPNKNWSPSHSHLSQSLVSLQSVVFSWSQIRSPLQWSPLLLSQSPSPPQLHSPVPGPAPLPPQTLAAMGAGGTPTRSAASQSSSLTGRTELSWLSWGGSSPRSTGPAGRGTATRCWSPPLAQGSRSLSFAPLSPGNNTTSHGLYLRCLKLQILCCMVVDSFLSLILQVIFLSRLVQGLLHVS